MFDFQGRGMRRFFREGGRGGQGRHGRGFAGGRTRRGDAKYDILAAVAEQPRHGYDIILAIEQMRGGFRPSPGSIYPQLQMLEDADYVRGEVIDGKRVYTITESGTALLAERTASAAAEPGFDAGEDDIRDLLVSGFKGLRGLTTAAREVARSGNTAAITRVVAVIDRARREIYEILADEL